MASNTLSLKSLNLRSTAARDCVLDVFKEDAVALAHSDLEQKLSDKFDRVTIYRTLKTFLEKGIIHKVLDSEGGMKYALCKEACQTEEHVHHHDHVHFKCDSCGQTTCLDQVHIPTIVLPIGYQRQAVNMLVQGICVNCG
jgi:Fur family transcriptional regulator, ferric uptake regulator